MTDKLPPKILVLESDEILRINVCNTIERYWFTVFKVSSLDSAIRSISVNQPNIAIISSRLQGCTAIEAAEKLRKVEGAAELPIIFLIDKSEDEKNYRSVDNGLIEIVARPFIPSELMSAIKSLLRRSRPLFQDKVIRFRDLSMDLATYKVIRGQKRIHLGPTEFKILQLMVQSPKTIFSRQQIMDYVWGTEVDVEQRTVDVHVNRLRSLIKVANDDEPIIKTVRAAGYCLKLPGEKD